MKTKIFSFVLVVAVLSSLILGCGAKVSALVEFVKLLPNNTNALVYLNVASIVKDPDLADMYGNLQDVMAEIEDDYGIALSSINVLAVAYYRDGGAVVITGNYDINSVRNALEYQQEQDFTEDEYMGVEIWRVKDYVLAFPEGMFVMGPSVDTVKSFIELSLGEGSSLYDDEHVKSVVDWLPDGINTLIEREGHVLVEEVGNINVIQYLAGGISFTKSTNTEGTMQIQGCYKFDSASDAEAALAGLEDYFINAIDATNVSSQLKSEFIELTGETELDLVQIFFY
jgi:hypothetical protein